MSGDFLVGLVIVVVILCVTVYNIIDRACTFAENMKSVKDEGEWFPVDDGSSSATDETKGKV